MMDGKNIEVGQEVLIFNYRRELGPTQDESEYKRGIVTKIGLSEDLAAHGSVWQERLFTVLGEDGHNYFGTYGEGSIGGSFFRTPEDQVKVLKMRQEQNDEKIARLKEQNDQYADMIANLLLEEMAKPKPDFKALGHMQGKK